MSLVARNAGLNFLGKIWTTLVSFGSIPFYLAFLGTERYGLVGFYITLSAMIALLDIGISMTLNKALARLSHSSGGEQDARDYARTLEIIYWPMAPVIVLIVWIAAPAIARFWFTAGSLSEATMLSCVRMMGISIGLQWPYTLYQGGLLGLQRQGFTNVISAGVITAQSVGGLAALLIFGKTIEVYFAWQIVVSAVMSIVIWQVFWQNLPTSASPPSFQMHVVRSSWRFSTGMLGISVVTFCTVQADKVLLSRKLPLQVYGCYTVAAQVASLIPLAVYPVIMAVFPRMVQLLDRREEKALSGLYHGAAQAISIIVLPVACLFAIYAHDIVKLIESLTHRPLLQYHTDTALMLLSIGATCNGLIQLPHRLQLASNWTDLWIKQNVVSLMIQIPLLLWLTPLWGPAGGAFVYLLLNLGFVIVQLPIMHHKRLLPGAHWRWYRSDVGVPLISALAVSAALWFVVPRHAGLLAVAGSLVVIWALSLISSVLTTEEPRHRLFAILSRIRAGSFIQTPGK